MNTTVSRKSKSPRAYVPVSALAVSAGFDSTASGFFDLFFTQTVATGSMTVQQYELTYLS